MLRQALGLGSAKATPQSEAPKEKGEAAPPPPTADEGPKQPLDMDELLKRLSSTPTDNSSSNSSSNEGEQGKKDRKGSPTPPSPSMTTGLLVSWRAVQRHCGAGGGTDMSH